MTFLRILFTLFALLVILMLGVGSYVYLQLPELIEQQARNNLQDLGLKSLSYEGLSLTPTHLQIDAVSLEGSIDDLEYQSDISSLSIEFDWRRLQHGEITSLSIADLSAVVTGRTVSSAPANPQTSLIVSSFAPGPYLGALPVQNINIQHWDLSYDNTDALVAQANGSLTIGEQLNLDFRARIAALSLEGQLVTEGEKRLPRMSVALMHDDVDVANISADLKPDGQNGWHWSSMGTVDYSKTATAIEFAAQHFNLDWDLTALQRVQVEGASRFELKIQHADTLALTAPTREELLAQFTVALSTDNHIDSLRIAKYLESLTGTVPVSFALEAGQLSIALAPTSIEGMLFTDPTILPSDIKNELKWGETVPFHFSSETQTTLHSQADRSWVGQMQKSSMRVGTKHSQLHLRELGVESHWFFDEGDAEAYSTRSTLNLDTRVSIRLQRSQFPTLKLSTQLHGKLTDTEFKIEFKDIAQSFMFKAEGRADLRTGVGKTRLLAQSNDLSYASSTVLPLLHSLDVLDRQINPKISNGTMALNTTATSSGFAISDIKLESELLIEQLSGDYDGYFFENASLKAKWLGIERLKTTEAATLSVAKLNLGIELNDTLVKLSLPRETPVSQPAMLIEQFSSKLFGGEVFLPEPKEWDFAAESNNFVVRAIGWQLSDMVALQQDEDIHAQGTLEGQLPVQLTAGRLIIADGYLRAVAPGGTIRYVANEASEALAASNPELELALDLLSDFHFEVLSSEVQLDNSGNLLLGLSLRGKNPAQFDGRPINFNINLEQNLDPLLQSLRLSDKLVEQLEGRLK